MAHHRKLDGVGDDLAANQRGLHALVAHCDAVGDGDSRELARRAARRLHAFLGQAGEAVEVHVARAGLVPR